MRVVTSAIFMALLITMWSVIIPYSSEHYVLEPNKSHTNSNDGFGPINYTDEHTSVTVGRDGRYTELRMPGGHNYSNPLPLVVALHGFGGNGLGNANYMHMFDSIHENEHLLLYPDGTQNWFGQRRWNATGACCSFGSNIDDVGYLVGLINEAVQSYGADPDGIVITGLSNGGFMSHRMACDTGNLIRSIVALNGVTFDDFNECNDTGSPDILHVHSTEDAVISYNGGSTISGTYPSAIETVENWANRSGCDDTWTYLGTRDITLDDGLDETDEFEFMNCDSGNRVAHWRINEGSHVPPLNDPEWADQTLEWGLSGFIRDSDGDGFRDDSDVFIYNPFEWQDTDGDGVGDNSDAFPNDASEWDDSDGDGIGDNSDIFPNDSSEWEDFDLDGIGDNSDLDDDNDGWMDWYDEFPFDSQEWWDFDEDGIGDNSDPDDDNDGWSDFNDSFPHDSNEWLDFDNDGVGDNADLDDDNDGWMDVDEDLCGQSSSFDTNQTPDDFDEDMVCDTLDEDDDSDGINDVDDDFPFDSNEWIDSDGDGFGDNSDAFPDDEYEWFDNDSDGVGDNSDMFPEDSTEWLDSDGDGVGDNSDMFPEDSTEWLDSDGDGVGDNSDVFPEDTNEWIDSDDDGVGDNSDVFPEDTTEWIDSDGDGVGDNSDVFPNRSSEWQDTDGDGYGENEDAFPLDMNEWNDTDGDGVGDNSDYYPLDGDRWEREWPIAEIMFISFLFGLIFLPDKKKRNE